jgi:hypothetical protein
VRRTLNAPGDEVPLTNEDTEGFKQNRKHINNSTRFRTRCFPNTRPELYRYTRSVLFMVCGFDGG